MGNLDSLQPSLESIWGVTSGWEISFSVPLSLSAFQRKKEAYEKMAENCVLVGRLSVKVEETTICGMQ